MINMLRFVFGTHGEYAGIGSRKLNKFLSKIKMEFACCMALKGLKLNSGAADGSDTSYETGAMIAYDYLSNIFPEEYPSGQYHHVMNIFLPWNKFNGRIASPLSGYTDQTHPGAEELTAPYHKGWEYLGQGTRKMMSRNAMQALSKELDKPVRFISAYTSDGAKTAKETSDKTGGTGQAIRIADDYGVPVYNFGNTQDFQKIIDWISKCSEELIANYGVDPRKLVSEYLREFTGIKQRKEGDLIDLAKRGEFDVLIHGTDCMNAMDTGLALQIKKTFPSAYEADLKTKKGARSKLGTYSYASMMSNNNTPLTVINAYTQYNHTEGSQLNTNYEAIRESFKAINIEFRGKKVGVPRIGSSSSNGCWVTISNIIRTELKDVDLTLIDPPFGYEPKYKPERKMEQSNFGF